MGGLTGAWLVGTGLVVWNQVHQSHKPPVPGTLLGVTGLFAVLALLADLSPSARPVITLAAWGIDLAGVLNLWPQGLSGQVSTAVANTGGVTVTSAGTTTAPPAAAGSGATRAVP